MMLVRHSLPRTQQTTNSMFEVIREGQQTLAAAWNSHPADTNEIAPKQHGLKQIAPKETLLTYDSSALKVGFLPVGLKIDEFRVTFRKIQHGMQVACIQE